MKTFIKILSLVIAIVCIVTSSMVFTNAAESDPMLNYRKDFDWGSVMHAPEWGASYSTGNLEEQLHQLAEMGATLLRIDATGNVSALDKTVMLCNAYGIKVMLIVYIPGKTYDPTVHYDTTEIEEWFQVIAKRYDGTNGCGKADYIQLDNEMDVGLMGWTGAKGAGTEVSEYDQESLRIIAEQIRAAQRGIRSGNPNVKIIINLAYIHYGFLTYIKDAGIEWDVTGSDWYSDMYSVGNPNYKPTDRSLNFFNAGTELWNRYKKPIIICECNMWTNTLSGCKLDSEGFPIDPSDPAIKSKLKDGSYWDPLVYCLEDFYNDEHVIGCTIYEFYDELYRQEDTWNGEANFGMMYASENGLFNGAKPIYYRCQKMFGGKTVQKLDWNKVQASFEADDPDEEEDDNNSTNTQSGNSGGSSGSSQYVVNEHVTTVTPEPIIVTPDPINKEVTETETVKRKVPVYYSKFFTLPIILSFVVGGIAILITAAAVTYTVIKKKKLKK